MPQRPKSSGPGKARQAMEQNPKHEIRNPNRIDRQCPGWCSQNQCANSRIADSKRGQETEFLKFDGDLRAAGFEFRISNFEFGFFNVPRNPIRICNSDF